MSIGYEVNLGRTVAVFCCAGHAAAEQGQHVACQHKHPCACDMSQAARLSNNPIFLLHVDSLVQVSVEACSNGCLLPLQSQPIISVAVLMHYSDCKQHYHMPQSKVRFLKGSKGNPPGDTTQSQDGLKKLQSFFCIGKHTCSFAVKSTLQRDVELSIMHTPCKPLPN